MSYNGQIGRQPFRPGQWSRYQGHSHKTYVQNNFYGSVFGGGYGMNSGYGCGYNNNCCDGGNNKFMNWMLGLGLGTSVLGGILGMFGIGGGAGKTKENETIDDTTNGGNTRTRTRGSGDGSGDDNDDGNVSGNTDKSNTQRTRSEYSYTVGAEKLPDEVTTHPFTVRREGDKCDNPWNVTAAMYTDENGNPIPKDEIKAVRDALFGKNNGFKVGDIQLKDSITVNGKTYKYNPNGKPIMGDVAKKPIQMEFYSATTQITKEGKWLAKLNGTALPGTYETEAEAKKAATEKGEALKKEHEQATQGK